MKRYAIIFRWWIFYNCVKGIGLLAATGGKIHDYEGVDRFSKLTVLLITINDYEGIGRLPT